MAERLTGIVTDGAADMLRNDVLEKDFYIRGEDVLVVPINILFEKDSYETGIDLTTERFRELIKERKVIPTTSIPNEERFCDAYNELVNRQNLDVVSIHVGSKLSGTRDMAEGVAKKYNGRVSVVDSGTVSMAQGLMVIEAEKMAAKGATKEKILEMLTEMKERTTLRAVIPNLDYVKRSGRLNVTQLYAGKMLGLIGIAQIDNNISTTAKKIIGNRRTINWLTDYATQEGKNVPKRVVLLDYGARQFSEDLKQRLIVKGKVPENRINLGELGPVTSSHGGPGTVGMSVLR